MAYARFGAKSKWYIFWLASDAATREGERIELLHAKSNAEFSMSFEEARRVVATGELPHDVAAVAKDDAQQVLAALAAFVHDVTAHYAGEHSEERV